MEKQEERRIQGIGAAEGIAIGPVFRYEPLELDIPQRAPESAEAEKERFAQAREQAQVELTELQGRVAEFADEETAAIFDAHAMLAMDPSFKKQVEKLIDSGKLAETSVLETSEALSAQFSAMEDEYFAARAADMIDVGRRVIRILLGLPDQSLEALEEPSIVVAYDLTPSDTAGLNPDLTLGICTAVGGLTSHTAILARTLGIPAVVGIGAAEYALLNDGAALALDGGTGKLIVEPSSATMEALQGAQAERAEFLKMVTEYAHREGATSNGRRIEVAANISSAESAREAVQMGAEGVGLLRTEFLYLEDKKPPSEEHQVQVYKEIFEAMEGRPVVVRTLDIGGDKPPSFLEFDEEMNPFLGWRAIRICLDDVPLFKTQLRGILRAAAGHEVLIMYPMIIGVAELRQANMLLEECRQELEAEGLAYNAETPVGIMVETPAAAIHANALAKEVDFFSIGANDLTQYTLAVDRTNERVAHLYNSLDPAVIRMIKMTIDAGHAHGKWVGMCGEMAGQKTAIPILLGLGLDEFSMVSRGIAEAKYILSRLSDEDAQRIAENVMAMDTVDEIEEYMRDVLEDLGV